ncbi:MAG: SDR family oxidoreductase [Rhodobiaceae bacterium]|nr:SDR family oxidoreductase [Rhodobiaceae bacterium]
MAGIEALFGLKGRTALVTGASRGIGQAIAVGLAQAGAEIVAVSRSAAALGETARAVEAAGQACHVLTADVADCASIDALFAAIAEKGLTSDILVNNAGMEEVRTSADVDEALWDRIVDTNLKGAFFVAQGFAKPLLATGRGGSLINLGSLTSAVGVPTATPYTSSKSGILGMTRALSTEWSPAGIRVNAIGPGYFRTALTEAFYENDDWQKAMLAKIPMNRFGALDDLVGVSVFLASDASAYLTGQIIYVDGGYLASI